MITNQEAFDKVALHLLNQAEKSAILEEVKEENGAVHVHTYCCYRGPRGLKCAIGALLPDEIYKREMENSRVEHLAREFPEIVPFLPEVWFSQILQDVHDRAPVEEWAHWLRERAKHYGLTMPDVLQAKEPVKEPA